MLGSPLGWSSSWRYTVTTWGSHRRARGPLISIRDGGRFDYQETSSCFPQCVWGPRDATGRETVFVLLRAPPVRPGCGFPAVSVANWAHFDTRRKKHIGRSLLEVTHWKHGRRKADALSLGDRPRRQDRCAENTRAHLGQSLQPSPDHRLFGERCRPKVAAADPHQRRMFLNAACLHTRSILTVIRCCERPAHQVFLITWLVINSSRNQYFIIIKAVHL